MRIGRIQAAREILIRCLHIKGKEQKYIIDRGLIQKINREIDDDFFNTFIFFIFTNKISVKEFETYYDMFFLIPSEDKTSKCLLRRSVDGESVIFSEKEREK